MNAVFHFWIYFMQIIFSSRHSHRICPQKNNKTQYAIRPPMNVRLGFWNSGQLSVVNCCVQSTEERRVISTPVKMSHGRHAGPKPRDNWQGDVGISHACQQNEGEVFLMSIWRQFQNGKSYPIKFSPLPTAISQSFGCSCSYLLVTGQTLPVRECSFHCHRPSVFQLRYVTLSIWNKILLQICNSSLFSSFKRLPTILFLTWALPDKIQEGQKTILSVYVCVPSLCFITPSPPPPWQLPTPQIRPLWLTMHAF